MTEEDPFESMLSERTIINGLMVAAGLILGPYLVVSTLEDNEIPLLVFGACAFLCLIFFVVGDAICVFPLLGVFLTLELNFLPFGLTVPEVFSAVLIFYYVVAYLAMRQKEIKGGNRVFWVPSLIIAAIVVYHNHNFGLHVFGSSQNGSRAGITVLIAILAYFAGINIPSPSASLLRRLPWYCLLMTCITAVPLVLTTYFPSIAPYVFRVTNNVNVDAYVQSLSQTNTTGLGLDEASGRAGFLVGIGAALQVFLISYYRIDTWWRPNRWFVPILSILCLYLVLNGGYRSGLAMYFFMMLMGAWSYCGWRIFFVVPAVFMGALVLSMVQADHPLSLNLPTSIQRTLSFLPGKWDDDVLYSTEASNKFRKNIQRVYMAEYFYKSPWIGNGFAFDEHEADQMTQMAQRSETSDRYYEAKSFIVVKGFHTGWISLYDAVGVIGGAAFLFLGGSMIWISGNYVLGQNADRNAWLFPLKVWIFCNVTQNFVGYFTVFGSFTGAFPTLCAYAIILVHLDKIERNARSQIVLPTHKESLVQIGKNQPISA